MSLNLTSTNLSENGLEVISRGSWICLENLDLANNPLTNCLGHFFGTTDDSALSASFPALASLNLACCGLTEADVSCLSAAVKREVLPCLKRLDVHHFRSGQILRSPEFYVKLVGAWQEYTGKHEVEIKIYNRFFSGNTGNHPGLILSGNRYSRLIICKGADRCPYATTMRAQSLSID